MLNLNHYICSDGPISVEQKIEVFHIRNWVLSSIDWDCNVKTLFREKNVGVKKAISESIDWIASNEDYFFVIECDCYLHPLFIKLAPLLRNKLEAKGLKNYNICSYSLNTKKTENLHFHRVTLVMIWGWYVKASTGKHLKWIAIQNLHH